MKCAGFFLVTLTVALTAGGQTPITSSDSQYTVVDRGPFWRALAATQSQTNVQTGAVTQEVHQYTELGCGMHCWSNGQWLPSSQALIELTPSGAAAVQGPHQAGSTPT